jgi:hypothetical protein
MRPSGRRTTAHDRTTDHISVPYTSHCPPHISMVVLTGAGFSVDAGLPVTNGLICRGRERLRPAFRAEYEDALDACAVEVLGKPVWRDPDIEAALTRLTVLKMYSSDFASSPGDPPKEYDYLRQIYPLEHGIYFLIWLALLPSSPPHHWTCMTRSWRILATTSLLSH